MIGPYKGYKVDFKCLQCHQMCFGVYSETFMTFMASRRRIKVYPEKMNNIEEMKSLTCYYKAQNLKGRLDAPNHFVFQNLENMHCPFFQALRVNKSFEWTHECEDSSNWSGVTSECCLPLRSPHNVMPCT